MIPKSEIEEVCSRVIISEVVGDFVQLKKSGHSYKACCPFHKEKSPSFYVNDVKGIYKCFGCGEAGDAIKFLQRHENMTYIEAVKHLAEKYHVTLHDQVDTETAEQRQLRIERESMLVHFQMAQEFFEKNLKAADKEAVLAHKYALSRWSKEDMDLEGFGYAYLNGPSLLNYATETSMSLEILHKCGLLGKDENTGRYYDTMRGRLTMPIRTRARQIIAYTARIIPDSTDIPRKDGSIPPKYVNTCDTLLYHKGRTLFGLDRAWYEAAKEDKCYCVEGAPDALRLRFIGIPNVVACLGADWTPEQLELLHSRCSSVCFIPDYDPPKPGQQFGVGLQKAIKAAGLAFQSRFKVYIKELGTGDKSKKRDADSIFTTKEKFKVGFQEEDFIIWYAHKLFPQGEKSSAKANKEEAQVSMKKLSDLLSYLDEGFELNYYLDQLNRLHSGKVTWQNAIREARFRRAEQVMKDNRNEEERLLAKFGFSVEHGGYYSLTQQGSHYAWSNFTMKPLYHIRDVQSAIRLYEISNQEGDREFVELRQEDLISLARFRGKVESLGNYIWYAKEDQLIKLKSYLYKATKSAEMITQLGWQEGGFFAFGNGIFYNNKWKVVDEFGIVALEHTSLDDPTKKSTSNFYLPAFSRFYIRSSFFEFEKRFIHESRGNISLYDYAKILHAVFGNNAMMGICFLLATLFRDVVVAQTKWFPILNLFGPKDSGKSEMGHCLSAFFIIENKAPNIETSTVAALSDAVGQVRNAIVHLDEFKDSIEPNKREYLKGLWDGTGRNRMNMDKDKKREMSNVDCGVVISGQEMATADTALLTRFIFLTFSLGEPTTERTSLFEHMKEIRSLGCSHLTLEILQHRPVFETHFRNSYLTVLDDIQTKLAENPGEPRIMKNWVVPIAALHALRNHIKLPFSYLDVEDFAVKGILEQNKKCRTNQELGVWWNIINYLYSENKIYRKCHFRVDLKHELKIEEAKEPLKYPKGIKVLSIRVKVLFERYLEHAKETNQKVLPKASLDYYLEHCPELIGSRRAERFDKIVDGVVQYKLNDDGTPSKRKDSFTDAVLYYNYDLLVENYKINLE